MQDKPIRPIGRPKGTGSQLIYDIVRKRILSLEMAPASGIDETALVTEFGISSTPVREALIRLATEGYVTLLPNRGASVSRLDIKEIPELLEAMELCLRVTSRWAATRHSEADLAAMRGQQIVLDEASRNHDFLQMSEANSSLHRVIAIAAHNRHMASLYDALMPQYHRLSLSLLSSARRWTDHYKVYFADLHQEHQGLIDAIERRDSQAADKRAQEYARQIGARLEAYVWSAFADPIEIQDARPHLRSADQARPAEGGPTPARAIRRR